MSVFESQRFFDNKDDELYRIRELMAGISLRAVRSRLLADREAVFCNGLFDGSASFRWRLWAC